MNKQIKNTAMHVLNKNTAQLMFLLHGADSVFTGRNPLTRTLRVAILDQQVEHLIVGVTP